MKNCENFRADNVGGGLKYNLTNQKVNNFIRNM